MEFISLCFHIVFGLFLRICSPLAMAFTFQRVLNDKMDEDSFHLNIHMYENELRECKPFLSNSNVLTEFFYQYVGTFLSILCFTSCIH